MNLLRIVLSVCLAGLLVPTAAAAARDPKPVRNVTDPGVVVTRQNATPAGAQIVFTERVYGVAFGDTQEDIWVLGAREVVACLPRAVTKPNWR